MNETKNLSKEILTELLAKYFVEKTTELENIFNSIQHQQVLADKIQKNVTKLQQLLNKLDSDNRLHIPVKDYLTDEQYQDYLNTLKEPDMLCEFDIHLSEWLNWFYEELPFISKKHLIFYGLNTGKQYNLTDIPRLNLVKVNHETKTIYIEPMNNDREPIHMTLDGINLYYLLNVPYQNDLDKHLIDLGEDYV